MKKLFMCFAILGALIATSINSFAETLPALADAKSLIAAGNYKAAFEMLDPLEPEHSGELDFDYLLGVAAIESGNVTRGVFALERVLATDPNNAAARTHIAKGYYLLGEAESAKNEYGSLLKSNPDSETAAAINRYMSAIDKSLGLSTSFAAYLDFGLGYDSNVNSGTNSNTIAIPVFGGAIFTLNNGALETSDTFKNLSGGISFNKPVAKNFAVFAAASMSKRMNGDETTFNNEIYDLNVGVRYKEMANTVTLALQDNAFYVDSDFFRNTYGLSAQWQHDVNETNQVSVFGQASRIDFKNNSNRDAERYIVGAGWAHVFPGDLSPVMFASAYGGKEDTRNSAFDFLSQDIYGARLGGQLAIKPKWVAFGSVSYENRENDGNDPLFLKAREDEQYGFNLGVRYLPIARWLITPQVSYIKNDSNIQLFEFDRTVLSVNFHHDFNW